MLVVGDTITTSGNTSKATGVFNQRTSIPPLENKYYIKSTYGGYNVNSIVINDATGRVTPNCVGYAWGRYNEIQGNKVANWRGVGGDGGQILDSAISANWPCVGKNHPSIGSLVVWKTSGYGHVAVVEDVQNENLICISESSYGATPWTKGSAGTVLDFGYGWINPHTYMGSGALQGYVLNPATAYGDYAVSTDWLLTEANLTYGGAFSETALKNFVWPHMQNKGSVKSAKASSKTKLEEITTTVTRNELKTVDAENTKIKSANLLSYPSLVEAPFITLKVGDYTFGLATKKGTISRTSKMTITFPNFMKSIRITKVNGSVNQYTISLLYQIKKGDDPNLVSRIFSSVGYGLVKISYGDWMNPSFIYKEEEALITKLQTDVDFAGSNISYTLTCVSNSLALLGSSFPFPARTAKPSDVIREVLNNPTYGLQDIFYGMKNSASISNLILSDDKEVKIDAKNMDPLSYINYLVTCMCSITEDTDAILKSSNYYLSIHDDTYGTENLNGPYFKITKVTSNTKTLAVADAYEVDVGYPGETPVMDFRLINDNSWSLLYEQSEKLNNSNYSYKINDDGKIVTTYSPSIVTSKTTNRMTEDRKSWWTKMTQFPVTATLTIKGLVRPAILMTYVRVNAMFYGQRHLSSGLYIITKQEDIIDGRGYRTNLTLTRIAGDNDYFEKTSETVTTTVVKH